MTRDDLRGVFEQEYTTPLGVYYFVSENKYKYYDWEDRVPTFVHNARWEAYQEAYEMFAGRLDD